jgi:GH15 family glucan-1,4-alpha-glucosidase
MASLIEDYALIGDCHTAALVARDGSIDWLCLPNFDSGACFASLVGTEEHGRWRIAPRAGIERVRRRYRPGTLILETDFDTGDGRARIIDWMPPDHGVPNVVRRVVGLSGGVAMRCELVIRFDYGSIIPWVRSDGRELRATGGPDTLYLRSDVPLHGESMRSVADFVVGAGQTVDFDLSWAPTHASRPAHEDTASSLDATERWWNEWSQRCRYAGPWRDEVLRSLITLKALTFLPTGGIVAAPTTSLPEVIGGVRNWDYRYCWLRDATFTLYALINGGYIDEARAWREWLVNAVAGSPENVRIMYGLKGERRLPELTLDWLPGYEGSRPVRTGNGAHLQRQLDVYGEVMDALHLARRAGLDPSENAWRIQRAMLEYLETEWDKPDEGIWEVRGPPRHFTHSKVMAWVALDRGVRTCETFGLEGARERWRRLRDHIHACVCREGYDPELGAFVQSFGSRALDASLLMIPLVGFLKASDPRVRGTVDAIGRVLMRDGLVDRYETDPSVDGLPGKEGAFLLTTFWYADNLALLGRDADARACFERLLALCNDVGLLSEEYDREGRRFLGNFPQAFSHVGLINTACNLVAARGPADDRGTSA